MPASYEKHRAQLKAILLSWGMPEENAETTSDILSWADLHGVDSHGMSMIPGYDRLRRNGRANMQCRPRVIKETAVSALVDGDGGLGHVPAHFAMCVAIDKAKAAGMAIAAVRNSAHFGATGYYTLMAAKAGGYPFLFFAAMMALQFFVVMFTYPETKNATLEALQQKMGIA